MSPEDLTGIDISQLDALTKLEDDHRAIETLATKALWRRDREVEIYARVMADYEGRMAAIVEQATPIRERVRNDLQKLDELYRRCAAALDHAKVKVQECNYRREIGEFTPEQYQECQQAAEQAINEREAEFEAVKKLRLRYRDVVPAPPSSVEAPPVAAASATSPARVPLEPVPPAAPVPSPESTSERTRASAEDTVATDLAQTVYRHPPSSSDFRVPGPHHTGDPAFYQTVAILAAMLIEERDGLPGAHHRLAPVTSIGREQDNHIVVPVREVSRRHAQIVLTDGVYVLKDLGSPNGTFVNGTRISEQPLQEGDRITLANQAFIFTNPS